MYVADLLSRSFIKEKIDEDIEMLDIVHSIEIERPITEKRLTEIIKATDTDITFKKVKKYLETNWPNRICDNNAELKQMFKLKDELLVKNGIILFDQRICVPTQQRKEILDQLHKAHLGIEKTKRRARQLFYWYGMNKNIENYILKCKICEKFSRNNPKEPLLNREKPTLPFEMVESDILNYAGKDFLVVDYYSNWIELTQLKHRSTDEVIRVLQEIFSRFGIPKVLCGQ